MRGLARWLGCASQKFTLTDFILQRSGKCWSLLDTIVLFRPFQDFLHLEQLTTYKIQHSLVLFEQKCGDYRFTTRKPRKLPQRCKTMRLKFKIVTGFVTSLQTVLFSLMRLLLLNLGLTKWKEERSMLWQN